MLPGPGLDVMVRDGIGLKRVLNEYGVLNKGYDGYPSGWVNVLEKAPNNWEGIVKAYAIVENSASSIVIIIKTLNPFIISTSCKSKVIN